jgi:hypothetical protein
MREGSSEKPRLRRVEDRSAPQWLATGTGRIATLIVLVGLGVFLIVAVNPTLGSGALVIAAFVVLEFLFWPK